MIVFFVNETSSSGSSDHEYAVHNLLSYLHYQFVVIAVYGEDNSTAERTSASMTVEGSELVCVYTHDCSYMAHFCFKMIVMMS